MPSPCRAGDSSPRSGSRGRRPGPRRRCGGRGRQHVEGGDRGGGRLPVRVVVDPEADHVFPFEPGVGSEEPPELASLEDLVGIGGPGNSQRDPPLRAEREAGRGDHLALRADLEAGHHDALLHLLDRETLPLPRFDLHPPRTEVRGHGPNTFESADRLLDAARAERAGHSGHRHRQALHACVRRHRRQGAGQCEPRARRAGGLTKALLRYPLVPRHRIDPPARTVPGTIVLRPPEGKRQSASGLRGVFVGKASRAKRGRGAMGGVPQREGGVSDRPAPPPDRALGAAGSPAPPAKRPPAPWWEIPRTMALVLLAAAGFRAVYFFLYSRQSILFDGMMLDASVYDAWAKTIASGEWIGKEAFYLPPLYPYALAVLYSLFGHSYALVYLLQELLGLVNLVL